VRSCPQVQSAAPALTGSIALSASARFYADSFNENIIRFEAKVPQGITASQMIAYINTYGLYRYKYNRARSGCLHWCKTLLNMLMTQRVIPQDTLQRFYDFVSHYRHLHRDRYLILYDRGRFLDHRGREVTLQVEPPNLYR
jgi:uncharacterized Fe-S cluster-containing MiaB family protein